MLWFSVNFIIFLGLIPRILQFSWNLIRIDSKTVEKYIDILGKCYIIFQLPSFASRYFWRTTSKKEIDLIEEEDGKITAYEFKWNPEENASCPKPFAEAYPGATFKTITPSNIYEFLVE